MKRLIYIIMLVVVLPAASFAQLKRDTTPPKFTQLLASPSADFLFGFLDPSKLNMHHSVSTSYSAFGGHGMMLSSYINTMEYKFSENLMLRTNLGIMTSPYNTFGDNFYLNKPQLFGGAMLHYKINEKSSVILQFEVAPYYYMNNSLWRSPSLGRYRFDGF